MRISFYFFAVVIVFLAGTVSTTPEPADAAVKTNVPIVATKALSALSSPARLVIPSLGMDAPIEGVGLNAKGQMAVPSGSSNNVGWYKYGTIPGQVGSAVLDAHVFAAFSKLKNVQPGADVYVITADQRTLHFVVGSKKTFALSHLSSNQLFRPTPSRDLNLITCAGSLTADHSTYDHRLIVYTTLVG